MCSKKQSVFEILLLMLFFIPTNLVGETHNSDWGKKLINESVHKIVSEITHTMEPFEINKANKIYRILLETEMNWHEGLKQDFIKRVFTLTVNKKLKKIASFSIKERRRLLLQDEFRSKVLPLDQYIQRLSRSMAAGKQILTQKIMEDTQSKIDILNKLSDELNEEFPELQEELRWPISESMLDCAFILQGREGGLSLRLSHFMRANKLL